MNGGAFDGGKLSKEEKSLYAFYKRLLNFTITSPALMGKYQELQSCNREKTVGYSERIFSFARWNLNQKLVIVAVFDADHPNAFDLLLPSELIRQWNLKDGTYS